MASKKSAKKRPARAEKRPLQKAKLKLATKKAKKASTRSSGSVGHNSGINVPLVKLFEEYERLDANKKEITKAQSDIRARAKDEHGVAKKNFTHEVALRKLDAAVRVEFEQGQKDLQGMLGYQFSLELLKGNPGDAGDDDGAPVDEGDVDHSIAEENQLAASSEIH